MKTIKVPVSKSLKEVWEWKDEVFQDIKDKTFEEKQKYFQEGLSSAAKFIKGKLKKNADGSYTIV